MPGSHRDAGVMQAVVPALLGILAMPGLSCTQSKEAPKTPEEAVRALARTAHPRAPLHERERIFDLLGPKTRARLEQSAVLAGQQAGLRRAFTWKDMLVAGLAHPRHELREVRRLSGEGNRAIVEVVATDGTREQVEVVQEGGAWKVELPPPQPFLVKKPSSQPTTQDAGSAAQ